MFAVLQFRGSEGCSSELTKWKGLRKHLLPRDLKSDHAKATVTLDVRSCPKAEGETI